MSEIDVSTPNLQGSCVTRRNQIHALFRVVRTRPKPAEAASAYESVASWDLRPVTPVLSSSV